MSATPYADLPYEEQLGKKQEEVKKLLTKLGNDLAYHNPKLQSWLETQKGLYGGLPCELLEIRTAEIIDG